MNPHYFTVQVDKDLGIFALNFDKKIIARIFVKFFKRFGENLYHHQGKTTEDTFSGLCFCSFSVMMVQVFIETFVKWLQIF